MWQYFGFVFHSSSGVGAILGFSGIIQDAGVLAVAIVALLFARVKPKHVVPCIPVEPTLANLAEGTQHRLSFPCRGVRHEHPRLCLLWVPPLAGVRESVVTAFSAFVITLFAVVVFATVVFMPTAVGAFFLVMALLTATASLCFKSAARLVEITLGITLLVDFFVIVLWQAFQVAPVAWAPYGVDAGIVQFPTVCAVQHVLCAGWCD